MAKHPSKEEQQAIRQRIWAEFSVSLPSHYSTVPNKILEAKIANTELPLEDRFDALLLRKSFGNWSTYAVERDWKTGVATALNQSDFAKLLGTDRRRISAVVVLRQKQGFMPAKETLKDSRLLMMVLDPTAPQAVPEPKPGDDPPAPPQVSWSDFSKHWDAAHADKIKRREELLAQAAPYLQEADAIHREKLSAFKKARSEKTAATPENSTENPPTNVRDSLDKLSATPRTKNGPAGVGHGIDTRTHALNIKQEASEKPSSVEQPADYEVINGGSSSSAFSSLARQNAEEEEPATFDVLKNLYPPQRFDEGRTKHIFQAMKPAERARVVAQLRKYRVCERWTASLAEDHGKWIPLSSNWLKSYDAEPPPLIRPHDPAAEKNRKQCESIKRTITMARFFRDGSGS